ncbi:MAG: apolipoprotein N-acyltransferase, partial [Alphaproteobacteria bacterium]
AAAPPPSRWWRRLARPSPALEASLAGALSALALPPVDAFPALLAYGWLLALLLDAPGWRAAWRRAVLFVFAQALAGLHWVAIAFTVDLDRFGALAVPAVVLLALGIALIQGSVVSLVALRRWRAPFAAAVVFAGLWLAGEWLRGIIGQFPWNLVGYAFTDWPALAQTAALGSVWLLGGIALMLGTLPLAWRSGLRARALWITAVVVPVTGLVVWGHLRLLEPVAETDTRLRLVQGAFALDHEFRPELMRRWFDRQLALTRGAGAAPIDAVIWAEGASPYRLASDAAARAEVASALDTVPAPWLITGGDRLRRDGEGEVSGVHNSVFAVDRDGALAAVYDKVDLVPFGEFVPLRAWLGRLGLEKLTAGAVDYVPGERRVTLDLAGLPAFTPLVCYEAIFAGRAVGTPRPDWLLNVTIDTWFGRSLGPHQHLAMARLRAVEEGLPLVRVANSGISAVIGPKGQVLERFGLDARGAFDVTLPVADDPTPFAAWRWRPWWVVMALALVAAVVCERIALRRP